MRLIDADELLMNNTWLWYDENGNHTIAGEAIENAPTVKATTNRGRWIKVNSDYNNYLYECSCCGTWTSLPIEEVNNGTIRYCWSCGARMNGVKK